jgi:hypothetical protein
LEQWELILWRGAVNSAIRGSRGQALLREMAAALDAMPNKRLISDELVTEAGEVCALGAVAVARGTSTAGLDPHDSSAIAKTFGIARALACEIAYINDQDDWHRHDTPEQRWHRVRAWIESKLRRARGEETPA